MRGGAFSFSMAYSYVNYTGDGSTTQFTIDIDGYLTPAHIHVYLDDVEKDAGVDYTIDSGTNKVVFTGAPASGVNITIRRITPRTVDGRVVDFSAGAGLQEEDLDNSALQSLFINQEILDDQDTFVRGNVADGPVDDLPRLDDRKGLLASYDEITGQPSVTDPAAITATAVAAAEEAATAAIAPSVAASAASASASAASASAASTSASAASASATAAAGSASSAASAAATAAADAAGPAAEAAVDAAEIILQDYLDDAAASASASAAYATAAAGSASSAATQASDAATSAGQANSQAAIASTAASASALYRDQASVHKDNAASYANSAASSASSASTFASASSTSASAAASSAASAASSATLASLIADGLVLDTAAGGEVSGSSVPNTLTGPGYFVVINADGTSQSKTWKKGQTAIYKGTSGQYIQLDGILVPATTVDQRALTRKGRKWCYSDGVSSGRQSSFSLGASGNIGGSKGYTEVDNVFIVPTSAPASVARIFDICSGTSPGSYSYAILCVLYTDGSLLIRQVGATTSDIRSFNFAGFVSAYAGQVVSLTVSFSYGSLPVVWINGQDKSSAFTETTAGSAPAWFDPTLVSTYRLSFANWIAGRFITGIPINRAWSQSDVNDYIATGGLSFADAAGGSAVDPSSIAFANRGTASGDYAVTNNGYEIFTGVTAAGFTAGHGAGALSQCTKSGYTIKAGSRWRVRFNFSLAEGVKPTSLGLTNSGSSSGVTSSVNLNSSLAVGDNDFTVIATADATGFTFYHQISEVQSTFTVSNFSMVPIGALIQPVVQPIPVLDDAGPNRIAGVLTTGITPITEDKTWRLVAKTSTSGNEQLLASSAFSTVNRHRIDSWVIRNNGGSSRTVSLGNASAGTQYASSITAGTGLTDVTLSTRFNGTNNLWCNSNGTDELIHTLTGHVVDI